MHATPKIMLFTEPSAVDVAEPASAPLVEKLSPWLVVELAHENEIAILIPASATGGAHDICALGAAPAPAEHVHPVRHCCPVAVLENCCCQVPGHCAGFGCGGGGGHWVCADVAHVLPLQPY